MIMSLRITTSSVDRLSLAGYNGDLLPRFVSDAHSYVSKEMFLFLHMMSEARVGYCSPCCCWRLAWECLVLF
jgi:hypothetical protein